MIPRYLAQPYPLSLSFLPPHAVVRGLGLFVGFTLEVGRGVDCRMPRRRARPCPPPPYSLPAHAVVCWHVLGPREITSAKSPLPVSSLPAHTIVYWFVLGPLELTFVNGHGVVMYDAAASGTSVPALLLCSLCTRSCVRIMPSRDYVGRGSRG